jgi:hypothetical protein
VPPRTKARRVQDWLFLGGGAALLFASFTQFPFADRELPRWTAYVRVAAFLAFFVLAIWGWRTRFRGDAKLKAVRKGERWQLGESYAVAVDERCDGKRAPTVLAIDEEALEFGTLDPKRTPLDAVVAVRVRSSWIEIETKGARFRLVPSSYADRERLLWELAYRRADAFEFAAEKPQGATTSQSPADEDVADLDRRMTGSGLGSALAGPMDAGNPAPPRKSGLGVGLFAPPPGDPRESSM